MSCGDKDDDDEGEEYGEEGGEEMRIEGGAEQNFENVVSEEVSQGIELWNFGEISGKKMEAKLEAKLAEVYCIVTNKIWYQQQQRICIANCTK